MLHGIETNSFQGDLLRKPQTPRHDIGLDFRVCIVEICEHEVIVVAFLAIDVSRLSPTFSLVAKNLIDSSLVVIGVVVGAREMVPVVLLLRVFSSSAGKVEAEPGVDFVGVRYGLVAVFFVDFLSFASLFVVCCCLVIED